MIRTRGGSGFKLGNGATVGVARGGGSADSGAGLALEENPRRFGSGLIFLRANSLSLAFFQGAGSSCACANAIPIDHSAV